MPLQKMHGEILNVKTGRILKKNLTDQGYYQFKVNDKKLIKPKNYYIQRSISNGS